MIINKLKIIVITKPKYENLLIKKKLFYYHNPKKNYKNLLIHRIIYVFLTLGQKDLL